MQTGMLLFPQFVPAAFTKLLCENSQYHLQFVLATGHYMQSMFHA